VFVTAVLGGKKRVKRFHGYKYRLKNKRFAWLKTNCSENSIGF